MENAGRQRYETGQFAAVSNTPAAGKRDKLR
jgi:hypothetical protein